MSLSLKEIIGKLKATILKQMCYNTDIITDCNTLTNYCFSIN